MKIIAVILFLNLLFASTALPQETTPQIRVEISTFKDNDELTSSNCFKSGERVNVKITMTNLSDQKIGVPKGIDFSRPTLFRNGELVSYRKYIAAKWEKYPGGGVMGILSLNPNETKTEVIELGDAYEPIKVNDTYKPLEIGEYQLSLEKRLFKDNNFASNTVIFKVSCVCSEQ